MLTSEFKYLKFPFDEFNPVQEACIKFVSDDCNLVLSSTMASGKTAIAEMIAARQLSETDGSILYVVPLTALMEEVLGEFSRHPLLSYYATTSLSDYGDKRLFIVTVERFDMLVRSGSEIVSGLSAVIVDEAHVIDSERRGPNLEAALMGLPRCRICLMSGTMSNYVQLARWLKSINGMRTFFYNSEWRPVEVAKHLVQCRSAKSKMGRMLEILSENPSDRTVVFVYSKKEGQQMSKALCDEGYVSEFLSADVRHSKFERIVEQFRNGDIDVLVATSVIGAGVNL